MRAIGAVILLLGAIQVATAGQGGKRVIEMTGEDTDVDRLLRQILKQGVRLRSFGEKETTLEDVFMMVTKGLVT